MKAINITKILFFTVFTLVFSACVQDDDYDVPNGLGEEQPLPPGAQVISISAVTAQADQSDDGQFTYEETNNFMEGYVISSDEAGNFFREIILQDKPENPTAGIKVMLFVNPLYTSYEVGRKIRIDLNGFTVGTSNGVYSLGIPDGNFIDEAPAQFQSKIYRSAEVAQIVPLPLTIGDFSDEYENMMIQLENMQFTKADFNNNVTYAGESSDEFDGERTIESCDTGAATTFSTSTFADFASLPVAAGSGSITGILSRNFEDSKYVVSVNDLSYIEMEGERCDPEGIECGLSSSQGAQNIFEEDFESSAVGDYNNTGWTNYAEEGSVVWEVFQDSGSSENIPSMGKGIRMNPYQSGDDNNIAWLVTPQINFDAQDGETFVFESSNSFSDDSNLIILLSTDWDGTEANITQATWKEVLDATVVEDDQYFKDVISSGIVDLSCVDGSGYIAFKYIGGGTGGTQDGAYEINDISVDYN